MRRHGSRNAWWVVTKDERFKGTPHYNDSCVTLVKRQALGRKKFDVTEWRFMNDGGELANGTGAIDHGGFMRAGDQVGVIKPDGTVFERRVNEKSTEDLW